MSYQKYETLGAFLSEVSQRHIGSVIMRETREVRPTFVGTQVTVGHVHKVVVVAYHQGQVLLVEIPEPDPIEIYRQLTGHHLEITHRRDNIT